MILTIQTFLKTKNSILQHHVNTEPSIKIRIRMTCMSKEFEIKTKMVHKAMIAAKNDVFIGL